MLNLDSLPSPKVSVLVTTDENEQSDASPEKSVESPKKSGNFLSNLLLFFKLGFSSIDDV